MSNLKPIPQPLPLAKMAYESLRNAILTGDLRPGKIINEMGIAKELGISKTPVREAFLQLSAQGMLGILPRKGVMVKHYTRKDVVEIFEVRKAIELAAIEKVTKAYPPCDLSKIEKILNNQQKVSKKNDVQSYLHFDRLFHVMLSELSSNRRFVDILENIRDILHLMAVQALSREQRFEEVLAEHQAVFEAIKKRKSAQARKAMGYHLDRSKDAVLKRNSFQE